MTRTRHLAARGYAFTGKVKTFYGCMNRTCICNGQKIPAAALDFHHLDRSTKSFNISRKPVVKLQKLRDEMTKCCVLCAICHRIVDDIDHSNFALCKFDGLEPIATHEASPC